MKSLLIIDMYLLQPAEVRFRIRHAKSLVQTTLQRLRTGKQKRRTPPERRGSSFGLLKSRLLGYLGLLRANGLRLRPEGGHTVREECVRHDLRCLSSRRVRSRSEVWQV